MTFKLDIGDAKSKRTFHLETNSEAFMGKKINDIIEGKDISEFKDFVDYEFVISGASDNAGFPALAIVEGIGRKRVLLTRGKGMHAKKPKGLRLRKSIRGNTISQDIVQINLKVSKQGNKSLADIFKKEAKEEKSAEKTEQNTEDKKEE